MLATQGVGGLWQMLLEKLGDIKEMILEQVKDFVITKIITAGITWLIGLLNPAARVHQGLQADLRRGDVLRQQRRPGSRSSSTPSSTRSPTSSAATSAASSNKINDVLGQMVPILIGFLASVIGLGGIGQKIREIIETLQKPVNKALDFVIKKGLKLAAPDHPRPQGVSAAR